MSGFEAAAELLPSDIRRAAYALPPDVRDGAEEFRLRLGHRPGVTTAEGELPVGSCSPVTKEELDRVLELATGASPYTAEESVRQGYVTARGGVRVGLCGRMRPGAERTWSLAGLTSAAIRIPRHVPGCGAPFCTLPFPSTLILSPPGGGKTTLLRDMVRLLSDAGARLALCDERGEVAAVSEEGIGFDVGERTDILSDVSKSRAALQLLRTMNPQILAMDEICTPEDAAACRSAAGCGVTLLATAHAGDGDDWRSKPLYRSLSEENIFRRVIRIRRLPTGREYREERLGCI